MSDNRVHLRVWGDFACFTRPEMKVERVSYPIMTPSAARGVLEAIFWEPQIWFLVDEIRVVKRGAWVSFRRNEVMSTISLDSAAGWMKNPAKVKPIEAGGGAADGTQRNMLILEDVEYIISAEIRLSEMGKNIPGGMEKYVAEFKRRARAGKCFHRPYLGMREFAADFDLEDSPQPALERRCRELSKDAKTLWPEEDLGLMLYDVFDWQSRKEGFRWLSPDEIETWEKQREEKAATLPKKEQKALLKEPPPRWVGLPVKPRAAFFKARVREAKMECHPEKIQIISLPLGGA